MYNSGLVKEKRNDDNIDKTLIKLMLEFMNE